MLCPLSYRGGIWRMMWWTMQAVTITAAQTMTASVVGKVSPAARIATTASTQINLRACRCG